MTIMRIKAPQPSMCGYTHQARLESGTRWKSQRFHVRYERVTKTMALFRVSLQVQEHFAANRYSRKFLMR